MANNPVDVVKTKMQGVDSHKFKGFMDCARYIYGLNGIHGFYMGIGPRLVRVILDVALTFAIFHRLKRAVSDFVATKL